MITTIALIALPGLLGYLLVAGVIIWLLFFVLPLPPILRSIFAVIVAVALIMLLLSGCGTNSGNTKKDTAGRVTNAVASEVFNAVLKAGLQYGTQALTGQNGQDAAASIFENAAVLNAPSAIEHIMQAYAGPQIAPIAQVAAQQFAAANPQTEAQRALILNTIGAAVQQVANQQFAK